MNWGHNMKHQIVLSLKGYMVAMLNNRTLRTLKHKNGYFPELFIDTTANNYLKQKQIELDNNLLLAINIVKNQIMSYVSFVSH